MANLATRGGWLRLVNLAFLAIGVVALAVMLYVVGWEQLSGALAKVGTGFALVCLAHFIDLACDAWMLHACSGEAGARTSYWVFLRATLAGHAINEATPLAALGEVTKFDLLREHITGERAVAALIAQNLIRFVTTAALIAIGPLLALLAFDASDAVVSAFVILSLGFGAAGIVCLILLSRRVGALPVNFARRLGVSDERVDGWQQRWREVDQHWGTVVADAPRMRSAWIASIIGRAASVAEAMIILALLGVDHIVPLAMVTLVSYKVITWITAFVPFQAGTTEGGALFVYQGLGYGAGLGIIVELVRRIRRVTFIGIGVVVLGYSAFRDLVRPAGKSSS